jgi:hypothetical protein
MEYLSFQEGKKLIQDGDIVLVCSNSKTSLLGKIISSVENSPVYHAGIAFWLELPCGNKELFIAEADSSGTCLTNLAQYHLQNLRILAKPDYVKNNNYTRELFAGLGSVHYSYRKSLWSAVRQYIKVPGLNASGMFCSEFVAKMWSKGGFPLRDTEVDPKKLEQFLLQREVKYRCWIKAHDRQYIRQNKRLV